jgi:DNA topoisomerase-1
LGLDESKTARIVFHEITKSAITHAIAHPRVLDLNLVNAQQARRILDRIVGFETSPILWKKIKT